MCPGNHDVNWNASKADPDARYMPFQAYINARNRITTGDRFDSNVDPERIFEIHKDKQGLSPALIFAAFNSAVVENEIDHRGYIGSSQLDGAIKEVDSNTNLGENLRIAVFHHHLIPVPSIESKIQAEPLMSDAAHVKQRLLDANFKIALHGHRHHAHTELVTSSTGQQLLVIGCGSSGVIVKERGEQRLQFNRLSIEIDKKGIKVKIHVYEFDTILRKWSTTAKLPPHIFHLDRSPKR
jgi:hypothetical protein